ncbi:MAG: hypothetical protein L0H53_10905 [Candidatus Nitrosocosmicus sp.]|nr:hypothetical protein [Candidatus Nitrosocosmicus sp.]MDN5867843.1 hypothetical protein [Candidatus Nitrosocosmicus sp.]
MSNNDKTETGSPDIIGDIIPGKNKNNNLTGTSQSNNNNQQSFNINYDEEQSARSVSKALQESSKSIERDTNAAANQIPNYTQAITDVQEQTAQTTREIAENYLEFQKKAINSFQSVFRPYFQNVQNQLWNNQKFFKSIPEMYSRLVGNYTESAIAFSKMWNDIAFSNVGRFKNATNKANQ